MNMVVIGAERGLGLEIVKELANRGHSVVAGLPRAFVPDELTALETAHPDEIFHVQCDVTDEMQVQQAAAFCHEKLGELDALINCAGIIVDSDRKNLLHEVEIPALRTSFEINTIGAVAVIKYFYPIMRKDADAAFVTIASEGCDIGSPGTWIPAYALSKCAVTKVAGIMNESVKDVRFYSVHPGRMRTVMGRDTWNMEADESARSLISMIESGEIHNKGTWYMDYKGMNMMPDAASAQEEE
ncbi:SDR family NAD(P)-dependent oxidoreductase [Eubacteriales bacterium OttesenSCG-928-N13]|nr:SDR family NAD(P)-dependent oxidoreductase [Eubacteriales bacterium OttesenSCG-928-N13]